MGWGFRKSVKFGGVRFTFSKRGISTSVGTKGLRVTSGPRGVYVTTGARGFYYRQRIGGPGSPRAGYPRPAVPSAPPSPQFYRTETFDSADVATLTDLAQDDFLAALNYWTNRGVLQIVGVALTACALVGGYALELSQRALLEVGVYALIGVGLARFIELRRRRFAVVYDLGRREAGAYEGLREMLADVAASGSLRGVKMIGHHGDWKRNAGATGSVQSERAFFSLSLPPNIVSNLVPYALTTQSMTLYFFPDRILIRKGKRFAALSYDSLATEARTAVFVWDEALPGDAEVIGSTWLYVNKNGGPDRRFNNNRQIPEIRIGYLDLRSTSGLDIRLQATRVRAIQAAADALAKYGRELAPATRASATSQDPELAAALNALGMTGSPSATDLKAAYHDLAMRNHPDRFAKAPALVKAMADQRMKELNAAYALALSRLSSAENLREAESLAPTTVGAPPESPVEIWATVAAVIVAAGVFTAFRLSPVVAEPTERPLPEAAPVRAVSQVVTLPASAPKPGPKTLQTKSACSLRAKAKGKAKRLARLARNETVVLLREESKGMWIRTSMGTEGWAGPSCWQAVRRARKPVQPEVASEPQPTEPEASPSDDSSLVDPFDDQQ